MPRRLFAASWRGKLAATSSKRARTNRSQNERANELLYRAILQEQNEALDKEAAEFYTLTGKADRAESKEFALPSRRSHTR
jgi:phosphoenolpyruvate synthase/pyruvate phosphate dikinase